MRNIISLNDDWRFAKTEQLPAVLPTEWQNVTLPHTWNAKDGQDGGNDYWRGTAMYCREFARPALGAEGQLLLEINGAANIADVYLNGCHLGHHEGGYSTFLTDLTGALLDRNILCIAVNNAENDSVYPQRADFTFYGGLYRSVNLIAVDKAHFDGVPGVHITPFVELEQRCARVQVETWQTGGSHIVVSIGYDQWTVPVTGAYTKTEVQLAQVHLWDGVEDPYLYTATVQLYSGEVCVDACTVRFGCRSFKIDPERGFLLNGREYPLRGVSRHQDRAGLGNALTLREHKEDIALIREIGANTVRLAHYQHAQEFYELCDEAGLVVWAEIPYITQHMPNGRANTLSQLRELITQCYNHPSIVCWGLSNEISVHGTSDDLLENHRLLNALAHELDKTRPTVMAHAFMLEQESPLIQMADIGSYNLYFGWYLGELTQNESFLDEYHAKFPDRVIGFSEYGADANPQFQSVHPERGDYSEQYQCVYHEHLLNMIEQRPWLWATHVWNMFDFAADGRDEGGKHGENQKGLVTIDRKLKKDAFYLYKAAWNHTEPFVHLCGSRFVERTGDKTEIRAYSNQLEVELWVDGAPVPCTACCHGVTASIPLTGTHSIEARAGGCIDRMTIRRVGQPNLSYRMNQRPEVANWFDEAGFDSSCYSIRDSLGTLRKNPETARIVEELMARITHKRGDVAKSANANPNLQKMLAGMSLQTLLKQAGDTVPEQEAKQLNAQLQKVHK